MNHKTSKLLRRFCTNKRLHLKSVKRVWNKTPWNKRHEIREQLQ
jgi:hypothetical protein